MLTIHAISGRTLALGREGENLARQVVFDISEWRASYGDGTVSLIAQRHGDAEPYPCTVTVDGNSVTWKVTAADTARKGYGKCELRYAVGDVLVKSETWLTYTADALGTPLPEPPEPQKAWVDKVLEAGQAAVDASVNSPKIGDNGNWFVWDFEAGKYVDTGVAASGGGSGAVSSVNGKTGAVKLTAEDVGAVSVPKTASVGQTIVVKAVDETGRPTKWEAADMAAGDGSKWEEVVNITLSEEAAAIEFDFADAPLKLFRVNMYVPSGAGKAWIGVFTNTDTYMGKAYSIMRSNGNFGNSDADFPRIFIGEIFYSNGNICSNVMHAKKDGSATNNVSFNYPDFNGGLPAKNIKIAYSQTTNTFPAGTVVTIEGVR